MTVPGLLWKKCETLIVNLCNLDELADVESRLYTGGGKCQEKK